MTNKMLRQLSNEELEKWLGKELTGEAKAAISNEIARRQRKKVK